ncbi:MAG TPA: right-handed parallel beta-helix repeat-containing protein, partial [bacterium]|nr:right-handed parallel beta-helix repeat-containing protein [bacterium]
LPVGTAVEGITFTGGYNAWGQDFGRQMSPGPEDRYEALAPADRDFGGGGAAYLLLSSAAFRDCIFDGNEARVHAGAVRWEGGAGTFERCIFRNNLAGNQAGAVYAGPTTALTLTDCELLTNTADYGGGVYAARPAAVNCTGCRFEGNHARKGAGAFHSTFCDPVLSGCAFVSNTATLRGGAMAIFSGTAIISGSTFALNDAPVASGLRLNTASVQLSECILAYQAGGDVVECTTATAELLCSVLWANQAGDYVGCLAGQDGTAGNFTADPRFCDWPSGEVTLRSDSPCLPAGNSCGVLIGAYGDTGCAPTIPVLVDTSPTGLTVTLDTFPFPAPTVAEWPPGTTHVVGVNSPQMPAPDERYTFYAWSDSGTAFHAVTAPDSADTLVATFSAEFQLTAVAGVGGTVVPSVPAFHAYASVESVTALPDSGYSFVGWVGTGNGSYTGPDESIAVTMYEPITQTATFQPQLYTVTMAADSGGIVIPNRGDHVYVSSTDVTIRAFPSAGWKFVDWSGTGLGSYTGTANPSQIEVLSDITQTAHFEPLPRFTLTMQADSGGTVSPPTDEYVIGTSVIITATPLPGFGFTGWTGTGSGSYTGPNNPATVVMNEPLTQTAHFAPLFPLTMVADSGGTVTPPSGEYTEGSVVAIEAFADPGRTFTDWTGTGPGSYTGTDNPAEVTVNGPITQTAHFFAPDSFPLTMGVSPSGSGTVIPGSGTFANGDSVVIDAIPAPNYEFLGWLGTGVGSYKGIKQNVTIVMYDTITETAYFSELPKFTLTMVAGTGGGVTPMTAQYYTGTQVTITAIPDVGNGFVRWSGQGFGSYSGPDSSVTLTIIADVTETAFFEYDVPVTIVTNPPGLRVGADGTDYVSPQTFQWRNTSFHNVDVDSIVPGQPGERDRFASWADGTATVARTIDVPDNAI